MGLFDWVPTINEIEDAGQSIIDETLRIPENAADGLGSAVNHVADEFDRAGETISDQWKRSREDVLDELSRFESMVRNEVGRIDDNTQNLIDDIKDAIQNDNIMGAVVGFALLGPIGAVAGFEVGDEVGAELERMGSSITSEWRRWDDDLKEAYEIIEDNWEIIAVSVAVSVLTAGAGSPIAAGLIAAGTTTASLVLDGPLQDVAQIGALFYGNYQSLTANVAEGAVTNHLLVRAATMTASDLAAREVAGHVIEQTGLPPSLTPLLSTTLSNGFMGTIGGVVYGETLREALGTGFETSGEALVQNGLRRHIATEVLDDVFEELDIAPVLETAVQAAMLSVIENVEYTELWGEYGYIPNQISNSPINYITNNMQEFQNDILNAVISDHAIEPLLEELGLDFAPESARAVLSDAISIGLVDGFRNRDEFSETYQNDDGSLNVSLLSDNLLSGLKTNLIETVQDKPELGVIVIRDIVDELNISEDLKGVLTVALSSATLHATSKADLEGGLREAIMGSGDVVLKGIMTHGARELSRGLLDGIDIDSDVQEAIVTALSSTIISTGENALGGADLQSVLIGGTLNFSKVFNQELQNDLMGDLIHVVDLVASQLSYPKHADQIEELASYRNTLEGKIKNADFSVIFEGVEEYRTEIIEPLPPEVAAAANENMLRSREHAEQLQGQQLDVAGDVALNGVVNRDVEISPEILMADREALFALHGGRFDSDANFINEYRTEEQFQSYLDRWKENQPLPNEAELLVAYRHVSANFYQGAGFDMRVWTPTRFSGNGITVNEEKFTDMREVFLGENDSNAHGLLQGLDSHIDFDSIRALMLTFRLEGEFETYVADLRRDLGNANINIDGATEAVEALITDMEDAYSYFREVETDSLNAESRAGYFQELFQSNVDVNIESFQEVGLLFVARETPFSATDTEIPLASYKSLERLDGVGNFDELERRFPNDGDFAEFLNEARAEAQTRYEEFGNDYSYDLATEAIDRMETLYDRYQGWERQVDVNHVMENSPFFETLIESGIEFNQDELYGHYIEVIGIEGPAGDFLQRIPAFEEINSVSWLLEKYPSQESYDDYVEEMYQYVADNLPHLEEAMRKQADTMSEGYAEVTSIRTQTLEVLQDPAVIAFRESIYGLSTRIQTADSWINSQPNASYTSGEMYIGDVNNYGNLTEILEASGYSFNDYNQLIGPDLDVRLLGNSDELQSVIDSAVVLYEGRMEDGLGVAQGQELTANFQQAATTYLATINALTLAEETKDYSELSDSQIETVVIKEINAADKVQIQQITDTFNAAASDVQDEDIQTDARSPEDMRAIIADIIGDAFERNPAVAGTIKYMLGADGIVVALQDPSVLEAVIESGVFEEGYEARFAFEENAPSDTLFDDMIVPHNTGRELNPDINLWM